MTTKRRTVLDLIRHLGPCVEAREWASGYTSPAKAWRECQRGDWMLWLLRRLAPRNNFPASYDAYADAYADAYELFFASLSAATHDASFILLAQSADTIRQNRPRPPRISRPARRASK